MNIKLHIAAIVGVSAFLLGGLNRASAETFTFNYTGNYLTWIVPLDVTSITFDLKGASGGDASGGGWTVYGGQGAILTGSLVVTPGSTLYFFVGGAGTDSTQSTVLGGFNGAGTGSFHSGGGGGGATDIRIGGIDLSNRVAVAGGGGGANTVGGYGGGPGGFDNSATFDGSGVLFQISNTLGSGSSGAGGGGGGGYFGGNGGGYGYSQTSGVGGSSYFDSNVISSAVVEVGAWGGPGTKANGVATITTVPEPSVFALLGLAAAATLIYRRNQRR